MTGTTRHLIHGAESVDLASPITHVEIAPADGGCQLLYLGASGECLADTWHASEADARAQARFELAIEDADWADAPSS